MRTFTIALESTPSAVNRSTRTQQVFGKVIRAVTFLLALLALTPIVALPFLTAVPLALALLLLAAGAALRIALVMQRTVRLTIACLVAIVLTSVVAVYASQHFARTPAYTAADGRPLPHSIAVMEQVDLNGSRQWITIRSKDVDNPVLLFLAGGPGGSELTWTRGYLPQLEEHFVVVNWDQAGAGKSYGALEAADMTVERYVEDAHALVEERRLETPVYFTVGRHDVNAMASLVERYYDVLEAPHKELIWFEKSGHTPLWEERDKFVDVLVNQVLADTQPAPERRLPASVTDVAAVEAFFDEVIPHQLRTKQIAGAAAAVVGSGGLRFAKAYGYADLDHGTPVVADRTLLRTDSSGKLFVWTAVTQLVDSAYPRYAVGVKDIHRCADLPGCGYCRILLWQDVESSDPVA